MTKFVRFSFSSTKKIVFISLYIYIHSLKDGNKEYSIEWKIIDKQKSFSSISNMCRLCLAECYAILYGDSASTNSKDEVWGFCRHARKHMLSAAKVRPPGALA